MRTVKALVLVAAVASVLLAGIPADAGTGSAPEDPEAARREITRVFEEWAALSTAEEVETNLDLIDDPRGVVEAAREAQQNFPYEVSHDINRVTEVRFSSPTEAEVTYDILIDRGPNFLGRTGHAVFEDGAWRVTRETVCGSLALAGGSCDGATAPPVGELQFLASSTGPDGNAASAGGRCPPSPQPEASYQVNARFGEEQFVEPLPPEGGDWAFHSARVPPEVTTIEFTAVCNLLMEDGALVPTMTFGPNRFGYPLRRQPTPPVPPAPAPPAPRVPAQPRFTG